VHTPTPTEPRRPVALAASVAAMLAVTLVSTLVPRLEPAREGVAESAAGESVELAIDQPPPELSLADEFIPGPRPLEKWEVVVARAKPALEWLVTYERPNGALLRTEWDIRNPTYFGGLLTLLVTKGRESDDWIEVLLPVRPNHTTAWVRSRDFDFTTTRHRVEISISERLLRAYLADELLAETHVVIGRDGTPTPHGRFYINERIQKPNPNGAYGPWILSLAAFSETLETFDGGIPVIGVHGTNQPQLIGEARSNGCVRLPNEVVDLLANTLPLGTPVVITA